MMKKILGNWGVHIGIIAFAVVWLAIVAANWAESAELKGSASSDPSSDDSATVQKNSDNSADSDYNFNWLDPEKKIYVLQNRRYTKANRAMISLLVGPGSGNAYRTVFNVEPRLSYYFSESFGFEGFYSSTSNSPNGNFTSLQNTSKTIIPFIREFQHEVGAMAEWIPWYAKINVFNSIIYFDWYFNLGLGAISSQNITQQIAGGPTTTNPENLTGIYWGTGHLYHLNNNWTARLDITSAVYHAANDPQGDKTWYSNYNFEIGLGYRF
jgi:outer membrane beta-barrel protein